MFIDLGTLGVLYILMRILTAGIVNVDSSFVGDTGEVVASTGLLSYQTMN